MTITPEQTSRFNRDVTDSTSCLNRDVRSQRHGSSVTFEPEPSLSSHTPDSARPTGRPISDPIASWHELQARLRDLDDEGYRVPCLDMADLFVSDEPADRQAAVEWCQDCPATPACAAYAEAADEPFHVWGGCDRSPAPRRPYKRKEVA